MAKQKTGKVYLYGEIAAWSINSAVDFINRFDEQAKKNDRIEVHIHCPGGNVFEGNMIYNKIINSEKPVDIYIDGIAASMASIIMLAGRKIYMAKNAFVMIHAPSSFVSGTADTFESAAKLLRSMEVQFIENYSKRTGKAEEDVKEWLQGDNWFSAQEAKEEKLVDVIIEPVEIKDSAEIEVKDHYTSTIYEKYIEFKSKLNDNKNLIKKEKMDKILTMLGLAAGTSEEMACEAIKKLQVRSQRADYLETQITEQLKQEITALVEKAVADKRITADKKDTFIKIGEASGIDALKVALETVTPVPNVAAALGDQSQTRIEISAAQWDKMDKEGTLKALKNNDPETFQKLFDVKFKK
ncbi:MAG: Clp protease ClpP [Bacteroidales bacterium]|jgi:ATP-dependent Clp endopeptidase proteolytic subunit ClpP|nr:Clp protease ClpP [Bacteroidales bacterium]